jgi:hypothetical protein
MTFAKSTISSVDELMGVEKSHLDIYKNKQIIPYHISQMQIQHIIHQF